MLAGRILVSFLVLMSLQIASSQTECSGRHVTYIITDGSESISADSFVLVKEALIDMSEALLKSNSENRIGVVVFSDDVTEVIPATSDAIALQQQIANVFYPFSGTRTDLGIKRGRELLLNDTEPVPKVLIVVTDGLSNLPVKTQEEANTTKESGILVFSVGVTQRVQFVSSIFTLYTKELADMANDENSTYTLEKFQDLVDNASSIIRKVCDRMTAGAWSQWAPWSQLCSQTCGTDITGILIRSRTCGSNLDTCEGERHQTQQLVCNKGMCPKGGAWNIWGLWTAGGCSESCGLGVETLARTRTCTNPAPVPGAPYCVGPDIQSITSSCLIRTCHKNYVRRHSEMRI